MRRLILLALVLALAGPAPAAPAGAAKGRMSVPTPPAAAKLRGVLTPDAPVIGATDRSLVDAPPGAAAERLFLAPATLAASNGDGRTCRLSCAQTYYFCAQADGPDACSAHWALCRAGCDAPSPVQSFAPR